MRKLIATLALWALPAMAQFPSVAGTPALSNENTPDGTHVVSLPTGIVAGETLLIFASNSMTSTPTFTDPSGFTRLCEVAQSTNVNIMVWYKKATGSEGASVTYTDSLNRRSAHVAYRVTGAADPTVTAPQCANNASTSGNVDTANLAPTGGAKNFLWFSAGGILGNVTASAAPANYSNLQTQTSISPSIAVAERQLNASAENPGNFTNTSTNWAGATVAVFPVATSMTRSPVIFTVVRP